MRLAARYRLESAISHEEVGVDSKEARQLAVELAQDAGMRGIDAGPLVNSVVAESLTSALIHINRTYKVPDARIRITGLSASQ